MSQPMTIKVRINGRARELMTQPGERVRDLLRRERILSVRNGCDAQGSCGACTIILDGRTVNSCLLVAPQIRREGDLHGRAHGDRA